MYAFILTIRLFPASPDVEGLPCGAPGPYPLFFSKGKLLVNVYMYICWLHNNKFGLIFDLVYIVCTLRAMTSRVLQHMYMNVASYFQVES